MNKIYFDNAATTMAEDAVVEKAMHIAGQCYGNPSSPHLMGVEIEREIKASGKMIGQRLNVRPEELYFTSGGTESNNLAILGIARAYARDGNHLITTQAEHPSVYACFQYLESKGFAVTYLPVDASGSIDNTQLITSITPRTVLVSIMQVNNETGAIADIEGLSRAVKEANPRTVFHSDGVQGFCKHACSLRDVDLYSVSSHKIHGLKGTGALYVKKGVKLKPLMFGGGQQGDIRPGTENTHGIVSFGLAVSKYPENSNPIKAIKNELLKVMALLEGVHVNGSVYDSPFILNLSFDGVKGETLVHALAADGIYVSTGAACSSKKKGNRALEALHIEKGRADSAVRFSFSHFNTVKEGEYCVQALIKHVRMLRKVNRR